MNVGIARDVASAVAWLELAQVQELLRVLLARDWVAARDRLERWCPELDERIDLGDPLWRGALVDELEWRLCPPDDEDPDEVATREIPDYTRYAQLVD